MSGGEFDSQSDQIKLQIIANRLANLEMRLSEGPIAPALGYSDQKLAVIAQSIYRARQRRLKHFDADLFGDAAWDMLLNLFVKQVRGERVNVTGLCVAARVPQATGKRWIDTLVMRKLVRKIVSLDDRRVSLIELTTDGYRRVRNYVNEGIAKFDMPAPESLGR